MAGFDGERYLRLFGERWVKQGGAARRPPRSPVLAAAAQDVVADYDLSRGRAAREPVGGKTRPSAGIGEFRVVPCARVIDQPQARLTFHYVAFTSHATTIRADLRLAEPPPRHEPLPSSVRQLTVIDSRGTTVDAAFSGSGRIGSTVWHGEYEIRPPLPADTSWIELLGERVDLTAQPAATQTWVEPLPEQDPRPR